MSEHAKTPRKPSRHKGTFQLFLTAEDLSILQALQRHTGLDRPGVTRFALRTLARVQFGPAWVPPGPPPEQAQAPEPRTGTDG